MHNIDTVLFDLDGVVIDSNSVIIEAWRHVASEYGILITDKMVNDYILGARGDYTLEKIFTGFSDKEKNIIHHQVDCIEESAYCNLINGFYRIYSSLLTHNIKMGLVTSSWHKKITNVFSLHDLYGFFCVVTRDDVKHGKPAPDAYIKAMQFWGTSPEKTLIFEDSDNGILSAVTTGAHCIALNNHSDLTPHNIRTYFDIDIEYDGKLIFKLSDKLHSDSCTCFKFSSHA